MLSSDWTHTSPTFLQSAELYRQSMGSLLRVVHRFLAHRHGDGLPIRGWSQTRRMTRPRKREPNLMSRGIIARGKPVSYNIIIKTFMIDSEMRTPIEK